MPSLETVGYIALGGNVGDVAETFQRALEQLRRSRGVCVERCSALYETSPVGPSLRDPSRANKSYLNAAAQLRTTRPPESLLELLLDVEARLGRSRSGRWQPRPIDLDLILYGDRVITTSKLVVPHPACWYRRFVLDPLSEIAADVIHPVKQRSIAELRERLLQRPFRCLLLTDNDCQARSLIERLASEFPDAQFAVAAGPLRTPPDAELVASWSTEERAAELPSWFLRHPGGLMIPSAPEAAFEVLRSVLQSALGECVRRS